jgi:TonB family protein
MVVAMAAPAFAQEGLSRAKTLYSSASYEEALQVLTSMNGSTPPNEQREVNAYQVFCLLALGRNDEAKRSIESLVKLDPLYHPTEDQVSPRLRGFFEDARRPLLPAIVKDSYTKAKDAFERKEMATAASEFDLVISLIDEVGPAAGSADMRTLAAGFRDLAKAAIPPPPPPPPPAPEPKPLAAVPDGPAKPATPAPDQNRIYTPDDADVLRPVAVQRSMPTWVPANSFEAKQSFRGTLELLIDERGRVASATMTKSVRPGYDAELLKATANWTFKPATRRGVAVKYIYRMEVQVGRAPSPR